MESVFLRFDSFDFEADRRFQDGVKDVNTSSSSGLLDLQLFFYNRFVEPIDREEYKQRRSAPPPPPRVPPADCGVERPQQQTLSDSEISKNETSETSAETEVKQLSFAEVMRLVQEGKEVPGATQLDIKPTNQSPTPSHMERRLKPWEISSASK